MLQVCCLTRFFFSFICLSAGEGVGLHCVTGCAEMHFGGKWILERCKYKHKHKCACKSMLVRTYFCTKFEWLWLFKNSSFFSIFRPSHPFSCGVQMLLRKSFFFLAPSQLCSSSSFCPCRRRRHRNSSLAFSKAKFEILVKICWKKKIIKFGLLDTVLCVRTTVWIILDYRFGLFLRYRPGNPDRRRRRGSWFPRGNFVISQRERGEKRERPREREEKKRGQGERPRKEKPQFAKTSCFSLPSLSLSLSLPPSLGSWGYYCLRQPFIHNRKIR